MTAQRLSIAWSDTTADDIAFGARLYPLYHDRIADLARRHGFPVSAACGAFAALSPRAKINDNFRSLLTCMLAVQAGAGEEEITVSTFNSGKRSALRILSGEADFADMCKGPKITAFRHNLLFPWTSPRVTIDGHMIGILAGKSMTMKEALFHDRAKGGATETRYESAERLFLRWWRRHPEAHKLMPCTVQAILWHAKRRQERGELPLDHGVPEIDQIRPYPLTAGRDPVK